MSFFLPVANLLFTSYQHHLLRTLLVIAALLIAAAGLSAVLLLNTSAKESYAKATQPLLQDVHFAIKPRNGHKISKQDYANLRKLGHHYLVAASSKKLEIVNQQKNYAIDVLGLDLFAIMNLQNGSTKSTDQSTNGIGFDNLGQDWFIHPDYLDELNIEYTALAELSTSKGVKLPQLKTFSGAGMGRQLIADIASMHRVFGNPDITSILVAAKPDSAQVQALKLDLTKHLKLEPLTTGEDAAQLTDSFHLNLLAMGLLMFVVCMFVVMNALQLLMSKRLINFKIIRQLGVSSNQILACTMVELVFLCAITGVAGGLMGVELASLVSPAVNQTLENLYGVHLSFDRVSVAGLLATCVIANTLGAFVALLVPFSKINHQLANITLDSSNHRPNSISQAPTLSRIPLIVLLTTSLLSLFVAFKLPSSGQTMDFISIALVIFSGCGLMLLATPYVLLKILPFAKKLGPISHWAMADSLRISSSSKIAFCAFFIAVAANIGMNLMVDSFRNATDKWINTRLNADVYLMSTKAVQLQQYLALNFPQIESFIRQSESGFIVENECHPDKLCRNLPLQIRSYPVGERHQTAMVFEKTSRQVWQNYSSGNGILINQQYSFSQKVEVDDKVKIQRANGTQSVFKVLGIYFDYGNPHPQALLPPSQFEENVKNTHSQIISLFIDDELPLAKLTQKLTENFPETNLITQGNLVGLSMATFDRTFAITSALNLVTFLVAAFSLATSIFVIDIDNRPQRGLMRAMGIGVQRLFTVSMLQYSGLGLLACLIAVPFGILLSWILINLVNVKAFHWSYPLQLDITNIVAIVLSSLVIVLVILIIPLIRYANRAPMEDIKWLQN